MEDDLREIGLTGNEAKVYLALIELGPTSALSISKHSGLHRSIIYDAIERLKDKGLVTDAINDAKRVFSATNPEHLRELVKEKEKRLENLIPALKSITPKNTSLDIHAYKGKPGIKAAFEEILESKPEELLGFGSGGENHDQLPAFLDQFHKKRITKGIRVRALFRKTPNGLERGKALSLLPLTQVRYLPGNIKTPGVVHIYADTIALISTDDPLFVAVIKNKNLANSYREYFEWTWNLIGQTPARSTE